MKKENKKEVQKKAYEFTKEDCALMLFYVKSRLSDAIEYLRAFRSVQDMNDRRESSLAWDILNALCACFHAISIRRKGIDLSFDFNLNDVRILQQRYFYPDGTRGNYIELANKLLSEKQNTLDELNKGETK